MNKNWKRQSLDGVWKLYLRENGELESPAPTSIRELDASGFVAVPGRVPGNFELDLQKAGLLPDLYAGANPLKSRELEHLHLWYARVFTADAPTDDLYFCFEGIDTFSEIYLNGSLIAKTDNMLIPHEVKAEGIRPGENELVVHILPVFLEARQREMGAGVLFHQPYNADSVCVRKAPHMFGWDIMPRILSGGLWRGVTLFRKPRNRIEEIYLSPIRADSERGTFHLYYKTQIARDRMEGFRLEIDGRYQDSRFHEVRPLWHTEGRTFLHIDRPYLWWPKGMGEPALYDVTVSLYCDDERIDTYSLRAGLRVTRLEKTDFMDEKGGEFCFYVNGQKMFVRGTNWVPLDAFHSRDGERLPKALELLEQTNCNMVRCWGGNVYESEEFFDFCDAHGIAVWQDFAMACSYYPQTEEFAAALKTEAVAVVKRLRSHASLFLWVGDNECDLVITGWHPFRQDPNDNLLTRRVLPEVIRGHDPFRTYLPSSPYVSPKAFREHKERQIPEQHLWGPRKYFKAEYYSKAVCRFASETGYHGCPSLASLREFLSPDKLWPWQNNEEWQLHATCMETKKGAMYSTRIPLMANQITELFGTQPQTLEEFITASQITQAEADKYFVERFRLGKWEKTTGLLWWNLLDGWPQFSDAVVDWYFRPKVAFEVLCRAQQTVCLMMREPDNGRLTLACANDSLKEERVSYRVTNLTSGKTVLEGEAVSPANSTVDFGEIAQESGTVFYGIEWTLGGRQYRNHYLSGEAPVSYEVCLNGYRQMNLLKGV